MDCLDEPELRHHAHGTAPDPEGRGVGPRLFYTHYPPGYLVPFAILTRMGLTGLLPARVLSIVMSVAALILMYATFALVTSPRISFLAVLFYSLSPSFLGYADSLANQPLDDLLRFAFMFAVVVSTRAASARKRRFWAVAAWGIQFILSLSSFDSVFFIYLWLIGWDIFEKRGFRWRTYALYALAPLLGETVLVCQNAWYLGWHDAIIDLRCIFLSRGGNTEAVRRTTFMAVSAEKLIENMFSPNWLFLIVAAFYALRLRLATQQERDLPSGRLLLLLAASGFAYVLLLPRADFPYQGRQIMPFAALLVSGLCWSFIDDVIGRIRAKPVSQKVFSFITAARRRNRPSIAYLAACGAALVAFWYCFAVASRSAVYGPDVLRNMPCVALARELSNHATKDEPVYFDIGAFQAFINPTYVKGYPQIHPLMEYYAGLRPILCFTDAKSLARDLVFLHGKPATFSPVVLARSLEAINAVILALDREGHLINPGPSSAFTTCGCIGVDLTDYIK